MILFKKWRARRRKRKAISELQSEIWETQKVHDNLYFCRVADSGSLKRMRNNIKEKEKELRKLMNEL